MSCGTKTFIAIKNWGPNPWPALVYKEIGAFQLLTANLIVHVSTAKPSRNEKRVAGRRGRPRASPVPSAEELIEREAETRVLEAPEIADEHPKADGDGPYARGGEAKVKLLEASKIWLKHPKRRHFNNEQMVPSNAVPQGWLNLFVGVRFSAQDCYEMRNYTLNGVSVDTVLNHIYNVYCAKNILLYNYMLNWMAHVVQKPGVRMQVRFHYCF